jgi:hypothetical protein
MDAMGAEPSAASGAAFFTSLIGTGAGYILFWGLPASILGWIGFGIVVVIAGGIAAGAASEEG